MSTGGGGPAAYESNGTQHQLATDLHSEFWRGFENSPMLMAADTESRDDYEDEEEGPVSYSRLFAPYSEYRSSLVQQFDQEEAERNAVRLSK